MELIFGKNAILTLLEVNKRKVYNIYVNSQKRADDLKKYNPIVKDNGYLDKLSDFKNHQGYVAEVEDFEYKDITFIRDLVETKTNEKIRIVTLDKVQDPQNFGQIIRTCECFGIDAIVIPNKATTSVTSTVVKTSTGASEIVPIVRVSNLNKACQEFHKLGIWNIATDAKADTNIVDIDKTLNYNLILGSEGFGVSHILLKNANIGAKINLKGEINSLNVSAACAIATAILD